MYVCMYVCMHVCMYVCVNEYIYIYTYIYIYVYMYIHTYVCMCNFKHTYIYVFAGGFFTVQQNAQFLHDNNLLHCAQMGWGGAITFNCSCTLTSCYAAARSSHCCTKNPQGKK